MNNWLDHAYKTKTATQRVQHTLTELFSGHSLNVWRRLFGMRDPRRDQTLPPEALRYYHWIRSKLSADSILRALQRLYLLPAQYLSDQRGIDLPSTLLQITLADPTKESFTVLSTSITLPSLPFLSINTQFLLDGCNLQGPNRLYPSIARPWRRPYTLTRRTQHCCILGTHRTHRTHIYCAILPAVRLLGTSHCRQTPQCSECGYRKKLRWTVGFSVAACIHLHPRTRNYMLAEAEADQEQPSL